MYGALESVVVLWRLRSYRDIIITNRKSVPVPMTLSDFDSRV